MPTIGHERIIPQASATRRAFSAGMAIVDLAHSASGIVVGAVHDRRNRCGIASQATQATVFDSRIRSFTLPSKSKSARTTVGTKE